MRFTTLGALLSVVLTAGVAQGDFTIRGSDSTGPLAKALAEAYSKESGVKVTVEGGGSSKGAKDCIAGEVDCALLSRDLKDKETEAGLHGFTYAKDAAVFIVNPNNPVEDLSLEELHAIYTGATKAWPDGSPVMAFNRQDGSATRELVQKAVLKKDAFGDNVQVKHEKAVAVTVRKAKTTIAYTSAGGVPEGVKVLTVNGVEATPENSRKGTYPLVRNLTMATKGEPSSEIQAFFDWIASDKGQVVVQKTGFVPLRELSPEAVAAASEGQ